MAAYYDSRIRICLFRTLTESIDAIDRSPAPEWLELELNQPPTNPNLGCIGEVDGRMIGCHQDDEERLRELHNLPE